VSGFSNSGQTPTEAAAGISAAKPEREGSAPILGRGGGVLWPFIIRIHRLLPLGEGGMGEDWWFNFEGRRLLNIQIGDALTRYRGRQANPVFLVVFNHLGKL